MDGQFSGAGRWKGRRIWTAGVQAGTVLSVAGGEHSEEGTVYDLWLEWQEGS